MRKICVSRTYARYIRLQKIAFFCAYDNNSE